MSPMKNLLFDMDGVLYEGESILPAAGEVIRWCRSQGIPHRYLTNTTSRPRSALREKLAAMGINVDVTELITPPVAANEWLMRHVEGEVALFVSAATRSDFVGVTAADAKAEKVAAVVVGDLGIGWDFQTYNHAFRLLMDNPDAPLIALGLTRYWKAEDGLRLDVGPFVKGLEYATGRDAVVMGKPAALFFETALLQLNAEASATLMIGDDIRGDIGGAQNAGINGVLVRTGKFRPGDLEQGITPYAVLDNIAELPAWWRAQGW